MHDPGADTFSTLLAISDILSGAENVGYNVVSAPIVVALVWFRRAISLRAKAAWRWVYSVLSGRRFVLIWIDDRGHAKKLIPHLEKQSSDRLSFKAVGLPREILNFPRSKKRTAAIVLLDTDVSKLADEPKTAEQVESRLHDFVDAGGGLIGGHDLIYRRARAKVLQRMFGCQLVRFDDNKGQPVPYRINRDQADHPLAADLPESYTLADGEFCWGDWAPDAQVVFRTDDREQRPLVVCREYSKGRVVWLNSGDKGDWLCPSIAQPEPPFITLLGNALSWVQGGA